MKVTVREKPINNDRKSLYLDFYPPIQHPDTGKPTRREFLGLYLFDKPRIELDRKHNKETKLLAQNICAGRQLEVQAGNYGFLKKKEVNADFLGSLKRAFQDGILPTNPGEKVKPFKIKQTQREFLSLTELQALAKADCDIPVLKRAGLFSALTGLRYGDIEKLIWGEVYEDTNGPCLRFTQQKPVVPKLYH